MIFDIVPEGIFIEMKQNNKLLIALLSGCLMFGMAACNFATPASPVTSPSSIPPGQTVSANISSPAQFEDPFAYCTAVVNIDTPDTRYGGQKMPEAVVKLLVIIITHLNLSIFYPEGVGVIIAQIVVVKFNNPTIEVFTVEKGLPLIFARFHIFHGERENCQK